MIEWVRGPLQCKGCHTYAEGCVMSRECYDARLSGYSVINIVDLMSQIHWISGHRHNGCDIIDMVGVMTEIQWK